MPSPSFFLPSYYSLPSLKLESNLYIMHRNSSTPAIKSRVVNKPASHFPPIYLMAYLQAAHLSWLCASMYGDVSVESLPKNSRCSQRQGRIRWGCCYPAHRVCHALAGPLLHHNSPVSGPSLELFQIATGPIWLESQLGHGRKPKREKTPKRFSWNRYRRLNFTSV